MVADLDVQGAVVRMARLRGRVGVAIRRAPVAVTVVTVVTVDCNFRRLKPGG